VEEEIQKKADALTDILKNSVALWTKVIYRLKHSTKWLLVTTIVEDSRSTIIVVTIFVTMYVT
jgi:hypothetical protein